MLIQITPEDIERGKPRDGLNSPVAFALHRALGSIWFVGRDWACVLNQASCRNSDALMVAVHRAPAVDLPRCVCDWLRCYDRGCAVEPLEFTIPEPLLCP